MWINQLSWKLVIFIKSWDRNVWATTFFEVLKQYIFLFDPESLSIQKAKYIFYSSGLFKH